MAMDKFFSSRDKQNPLSSPEPELESLNVFTYSDAQNDTALRKLTDLNIWDQSCDIICMYFIGQ